MVRQSKGRSQEWVGVTTLMLRNIPSCYTQQMLVDEICSLGFQGGFDFFYLPFDMKSKKTNMGYAFINMKSEAMVLSIVSALDGMPLERSGRKVVRVVPAQTQGYEANLAHFAHSAVLNHHKTEHSPLFLREDAPLPGVGRQERERRPRELVLPEGTTTLTLRVLSCPQPVLYMDLCARGFGSHIDFVHVDHSSGTVNFTTTDAATRAAMALEGSIVGGSRVRVSAAPIQGCGANIVYFATLDLSRLERPAVATVAPAPVRPKRVEYRALEYTCPVSRPVTPEMRPFEYTCPVSRPLTPEMDVGIDLCKLIPSRFASLGVETDESEEPSTPEQFRQTDLEKAMSSFPSVLSSPECLDLPCLRSDLKLIAESASTSSGVSTPPLTTPPRQMPTLSSLLEVA